MCETCTQKALKPESERVYANGVWIDNEIPYIVDRFKGESLLVMGCGHSLWGDVARTQGKFKGHKMAVSRIIMDLQEPIEHACSCHPDDLFIFSLYRRKEYLHHPHFYTHSCRLHDEWTYENHLIPQFLWDFPDYYHGSSSLTAVLAGLAMGYENIILAGVPVDGFGYYHNPNWIYPYDTIFMADWEKAAKNTFAGRVTSLSGNTRELLGEPKGY